MQFTLSTAVQRLALTFMLLMTPLLAQAQTASPEAMIRENVESKIGTDTKFLHFPYFACDEEPSDYNDSN